LLLGAFVGTANGLVNHYVTVLPVAQRQMVEILRASHRKARYVLLDEPTTARARPPRSNWSAELANGESEPATTASSTTSTTTCS
jgi:ABC-type sugar transport system ATPase subunit